MNTNTQARPGGGGMQDEMMLEYLLEMGALSPEQEQVMRQRKMVDELRGMPMPSDTRNAGRLQVARNPLEMLAPVIGQGIANWKEGKADAAGKALQDKRLAGLGRMRDRFKQPSVFPQRPMPGEDDPSGSIY